MWAFDRSWQISLFSAHLRRSIFTNMHDFTTISSQTAALVHVSKFVFLLFDLKYYSINVTLHIVHWSGLRHLDCPRTEPSISKTRASFLALVPNILQLMLLLPIIGWVAIENGKILSNMKHFCDVSSIPWHTIEIDFIEFFCPSFQGGDWEGKPFTTSTERCIVRRISW